MLVYLQQDFSVVQDQGGPLNYENPVRRDVTPVAENKTTIIRFRSDNAGPWFLHW
jgi:iron transport multicopper oxidase